MSQQACQQLVAALVTTLSATEQSSEASAADLRKVRLLPALAA